MPSACHAEKLRDHFGKYGSIVEAVSYREGQPAPQPPAPLGSSLGADHPILSAFILQVVMRDRQTGRPRGFGFVTFTTPDAADAVVQDIHVIDGRQVRHVPTNPTALLHFKCAALLLLLGACCWVLDSA